MTFLRTPAQEQDSDRRQPTAGLAGSGRVARRGVMKLAGRGGIALVAGLSGVFATTRPAAAAPVCCYLATSHTCSGHCENYTCPSGYYKRYWWCTAGTRLIGCGECQKNSGDCWSGGSYKCSIWWDDGAC